MAQRCLVINEWIFEDLLGRNGEEKRIESLHFLEVFLQRNDCIAVLFRSRWVEKAFNLMKHNKLEIRKISKVLYREILMNPLKCQILYRGDICEINNDISEEIPEGKDFYLVEIYFSAKADLIITTDIPLYEFLILKGINVSLRDDFIKSYLYYNN